MLRYLVPFLVTLSAVTSYHSLPSYTRDSYASAASNTQIKFAEENKYDDTGPGAKKPEYAYNTYKTLEEALVAYLDDPDTKLPEHERAKAVQKLLNSQVPGYIGISGHYPKSYNGPAYQKPQQTFFARDYNRLGRKPYYISSSRTGNVDTGHYNFKPEKPEPFKFQKLKVVKGNPISLAHFTRYPELRSPFTEHNPFPQYTYSYGVHDKVTGDVKSVAESRAGGNVQGFYSYIDANGKPHTVHYTADDVKGFRAAVAKTH